MGEAVLFPALTGLIGAILGSGAVWLLFFRKVMTKDEHGKFCDGQQRVVNLELSHIRELLTKNDVRQEKQERRQEEMQRLLNEILRKVNGRG